MKMRFCRRTNFKNAVINLIVTNFEFHPDSPAGRHEGIRDTRTKQSSNQKCFAHIQMAFLKLGPDNYRD